MTIITDPLFYALAVPAVVALGLSKGGFAGAGQMATPMLALAMPPLEAAAILLPIMMAQDAAALWVYRKDWNWRILAITCRARCVGVCGAWVLAAHISDAAVRVFIGVTTIGFVLYHWIGPRISHEVGEPGKTGGMLAGAMSGFTSTLCQAGGPPFQMYVLCAEAGENEIRRHHRLFLRHRERAQSDALFRARAILAKGLGTSLALLAARHGDQHAGLLGGAHHAAGDVLQDHHGADVRDFDRAAALRDGATSCAAEPADGIPRLS